MQLKALSGRVQIIQGPTTIGVLLLNDDRVALIDSGLDRRSSRRLLEFLNDYQYRVTCILNTHAHADHIGGNALLYETSKCRILAGPHEAPAIQNTLIQAIALYGGYPFEELMNHFIVAESSPAEIITTPTIQLEDLSVEVVDLPGHSIGQKGFLVDGVLFYGDTLFPAEVIQKHHLLYMYNPTEQLETLRRLGGLKANWYVGGHVLPEKNIDRLITENVSHVESVFSFLRQLIVSPQPLDKLVKEFLGKFQVRKKGWEHFLYRSTLNGYLSALKYLKEADVKVIENLLVWYKPG
jgi:glyoxylase-like metal-dependent hydrolase (beta-lactamase superfamily II)